MTNRINTIDEYIAQFSYDVQLLLQQFRETVHRSAPNAKETISYGMPAFKQDKVLVYFAAFKKHIGFYPLPPTILYFRDELTKYKQSKGAIQFPLNEPLPVKLIEKIVKFRVEEDVRVSSSNNCLKKQ